MEDETGFELLFLKVEEALKEDCYTLDHEDYQCTITHRFDVNDELDAIDNLRRIVLEVTEPEVRVFTTT